MKKIFTILTATAIGLLSYFLIAQADTNQITYSEKFINNLTKCTPISESSTVKTPYYTTVNGQKELKGYLNTYINFWIQGKKEGKCMFFTIKRTTPVPQGDEYKMLRLTSTARIECLLTPEEQLQFLKEMNIKCSDLHQLHALSAYLLLKNNNPWQKNSVNTINYQIELK